MRDSATCPEVCGYVLSKNILQYQGKGVAVFTREAPEFSENKSIFNGGKNGFEYGRLEQSCVLPVINHLFSQPVYLVQTAGNGHDNQVRPPCIIFIRADHLLLPT